MDKLLIDKYGECQLYNTDTNSLGEVPSGIETRAAYFATAPGQAITSTEVVDYYEGDLVLVVVYYGKNTRTKIIVVNDAVAKDDIQRWFEEIKQIDNE